MADYSLLRYDDIANAIVTRHVTTAMAQALAVAPTDTQAAAYERLEGADFDYAPVRHDKSLVGRISRARLDPTSMEVASRVLDQLDDRMFVSADLKLPELMRELQRTPFLFVVDGAQVTGFVTPSDLNKEAVRAYFFLMIVDLEMGLAATRRARHYTEQRVIADLAQARTREVKRRINAQRSADRHIDAIAVLDLKDLVHLCSSLGVDWLGKAAHDPWRQLTAITRITGSPEYEVVRLRNDSVHPAGELLVGGRSLHDLVRVETALRLVLRDLESSDHHHE